MVIELLLCLYLLSQTHLSLPTRLLFILFVLWIIYGIRYEYESTVAAPIRTEKIPVGSFITYSFNRLAYQKLNPLIPLRLLGERYLHFGIVVDNKGRKDVLEWRLSQVDSLKQYKILDVRIGCIYSIPIERYVEENGKLKLTFGVFYPPREQSVPLEIEHVVGLKDHFLYCTRFVFSYAEKVMGLRTSPFFYLPGQCAKELRQKGWREEYYIYDK